MRELMPLEINCNPVNFESEIVLAEGEGFGEARKGYLIDNLEYFKRLDAPLYNHAENKVKFVYYFEYKGSVCKISALTLKVFFIGKSNKKWLKYKKGDKLEYILFDKASRVVEEALSSNVCKVELVTCTSQKDRLTERQFYFMLNLLRKSEKTYLPKTLEVINKDTAHLLIEALLRGKVVHFTDNIQEEFTEREMDLYLDAISRGKELEEV